MSNRLDKLALESKFDSQETKKSADVVPTTNQFAIAGSNPIFFSTTKIPMNNNFDDNISQTSGDSDLIGIEDNPNFNYNNDKIMWKTKLNEEKEVSLEKLIIICQFFLCEFS